MRKKIDTKRDIAGDSKFDSVSIARFINYIMKDGKKSVAERVVYGALDVASEKLKSDSVEIFEKALANVSPTLEVVSRRVGGANYQVPHEVRPKRRFYLACKWIIEAASSQKGKPMSQRLANEIILAFNNEGSAVKKRETVHKMAESNRAFAHFAR